MWRTSNLPPVYLRIRICRFRAKASPEDSRLWYAEWQHLRLGFKHASCTPQDRIPYKLGFGIVRFVEDGWRWRGTSSTEPRQGRVVVLVACWQFWLVKNWWVVTDVSEIWQVCFAEFVRSGSSNWSEISDVYEFKANYILNPWTFSLSSLSVFSELPVLLKQVWLAPVYNMSTRNLRNQSENPTISYIFEGYPRFLLVVVRKTDEAAFVCQRFYTASTMFDVYWMY